MKQVDARQQNTLLHKELFYLKSRKIYNDDMVKTIAINGV